MVDLLENVACMDVTTQLELYLHKQPLILTNAVGSQLATCFLTFYYDPYSLFNFLNFYLFLASIIKLCNKLSINM